MRHLEHDVRRPVEVSPTADRPPAVLDTRCGPPDVVTTDQHWAAVEKVAAAAAEAVAAAAAAEVACEAAATAQAAVEAASAAADKAARRARRVAADAARIVATATATQQGLRRTEGVDGPQSSTELSVPSEHERLTTYMRAAAEAAASPRVREAQDVARRVVLVAEAAATAAIDAARVVAAQLDKDVSALADGVIAPAGGDGHDVDARRSKQTHARLLAVAESAREQAEQGLAEAQRLGGLGSWKWTVATNEVIWSQECCRLFGVDPATFPATYDGFLACVHPEDREYVSAAVASVFEGAAGYEIDHRVRHQNGDELWLRGRGSALRDDDGTPIWLYGTVIDTTSAKLAEARDQQQVRDLAQIARHDNLTGLVNRGTLFERLAHAVAQRGQTVSVLLLDLDDFKAINDTAGHAAGDRLLVDVATRLLQSARRGDTVARLGGDEFAIVMERGDPVQLAERIRKALATPVLLGATQVVPLVSIGIATAEGVTSGEELLLQADVAMYEAKAAGKGSVVRFDAAMADRGRLRTDLQAGLREAVARGEIVVHYQPIIDVGAQSMSRVEALVRWQRPAGLVSPADFLPLAEETGLIVGIGQEVLRQACEQLHDWLAADDARSVSVNVSPLQLLAGDFADRVLDLLVHAGVDPDQIVLEVTETLFLTATPILVEQLQVLRRHGVRVSIDDFGTGYSSLGRLHQLPIDSIKIDKSFVDLLRSGDEQLPIINSMIVMAHALHLDVTAEGVETAEQARRLVELGCDYLQGFHFARPSPADTATGPAADQASRTWRALGRFVGSRSSAEHPELVPSRR